MAIDKDVARGELVTTLLEKVRNDPFPSTTMLDLIEELLTPRRSRRTSCSCRRSSATSGSPASRCSTGSRAWSRRSSRAAVPAAGRPEPGLRSLPCSSARSTTSAVPPCATHVVRGADIRGGGITDCRLRGVELSTSTSTASCRTSSSTASTSRRSSRPS